MGNTTFIIYRGHNEMIVTTPELEQAMLREYFELGGRDRDDYDRVLPVENVLVINCRINLQ